MTTIKPSQVAQVAKIDEMIAALNEKRAGILEIIRAAEPTGTKIFEYKGENYVLKATQKEMLDTKEFQADHPWNDYPQYYKDEPVFSATLVKGKDREGYLVKGTTAISISKAE